MATKTKATKTKATKTKATKTKATKNTKTPKLEAFVKTLLREMPQFRHNVARSGEDFETFVIAPDGSKAGARVCLSSTGNVWIRYAPPRCFYGVDTPGELVRIAKVLLADEALFVVTSKARRWTGTTLIRPGDQPVVKKGETARVISWSGRHDRTVRKK